MPTRFIKWFFRQPEEPRPGIDVVIWWEARRIPYNLIVGLSGIVSLPIFFLFIELAHGLDPGEDAVEPMALIAAPIVMNIAYTTGWVVELLLRLVWLEKPLAIAPVFLKLGILFSLFVAFFPAIFWGAIWIFQSL